MRLWDKALRQHFSFVNGGQMKNASGLTPRPACAGERIRLDKNAANRYVPLCSLSSEMNFRRKGINEV